MRMLSLALAFVAALIVSSTSQAGLINVMNGAHNVIIGTNPGHLGLNGLGHTSTLLSDSASGWATAMSDTKTIVVEQGGGGSKNTAAVQAFISGGGRVILLGDGSGASTFINDIFSTSVSTEFLGADLEPFSQTAAVAGTTFADDAPTIFGLSSHHEVISGVLPTGSQVFYQGAGDPIVFRATLGAGDFFYLGWDYCCGGSTAQANDWYGVLDSAIEFESAEIPEPASVAIFGIGALGCLVVRRRRNKK